MIVDIQQSDTIKNRIQSFAYVIAVGAAVCFAVYCVVSSFVRLQSASGGYEVRLESRINPNTASADSLARLPGVGIVRAGAIVEYRKSFNRKNGNSPCFQNCDDLQKVKGIGPKTAQNISQWMRYE